jgi:hypothetical protein
MDIESSQSDTSSDKANKPVLDRYCVKCRKRTETLNEEMKVNKCGIPYMSSVCGSCGTKKTQFVKSSLKTEEMKRIDTERHRKRVLRNEQLRKEKEMIKNQSPNLDDIVSSIVPVKKPGEKKAEKKELIKSIRLLQKSIDLINQRIQTSKNMGYRNLLKEKAEELDERRQELLSELNDRLDETD